MSSNKMELYDVSKKMREAIEWKDARKKALREQYLRQSLHPRIQTPIIDEAVLRVNTLRATQEYYSKVTGKVQIVAALCAAAALASWVIFIRHSRWDREERLRTGRISYADREFKFA